MALREVKRNQSDTSSFHPDTIPQTIHAHATLETDRNKASGGENLTGVG